MQYFKIKTECCFVTWFKIEILSEKCYLYEKISGTENMRYIFLKKPCRDDAVSNNKRPYCLVKYL